jgi:hypothetical protein
LIISSLRGDGCLQSNALLSGRARVKIQVNPCACVDIVSYHLQHSQIYSDEIFLLVHRTVCMLNRRWEYISQTGYRNILLFFQKNRFRIMGIVFFAKRIMGIVELIIYGFPRKPAQLFCFCHLFFAYYTWFCELFLLTTKWKDRFACSFGSRILVNPLELCLFIFSWFHLVNCAAVTSWTTRLITVPQALRFFQRQRIFFAYEQHW